MTACNAGQHIAESIESVLKQSFNDFELIVVNTGSIDEIRTIIDSFGDKRIRLLDSSHDRIQSINWGINASTGKYIALHDAGSIMHIDRLKLQYTMMEEFPEIAICSSWETVFGEKLPKRIIEQKVSGLLEMPLVQLLFEDIIIHPAYTIRRSFITEHQLFFENCDRAEDYQFWVETAKRDGGIYIDSCPLVYRRLNDSTVLRNHRLEKIRSISGIKKEILLFLCKKYEATYPELTDLFHSYTKMRNHQLVTEEDIYKQFHSIFIKNRDTFTSL